jgi:hypothetical protein
VLGGGAAGRARLRAHNHRHRQLSAGHVAVLGGLIDQTIERKRREIDEHDFQHRPKAAQRGTGRHAGDRGFADGCVAHALRAEFLSKAIGHAERPACRHVLAQQVH